MMPFKQPTQRTIALLLLAFGLNLTATAQFSLSGSLPQLPEGSALQLVREDLDERARFTVATLTLGANGRFHKRFTEEAGYYKLVFPDGSQMPLALSPNQKVIITQDPSSPTGYATSGSPDTEDLLAYERYRKESLARLVYPPRAALNAAKSSGIPASQLNQLAQAEVEGYVAHRHELNDFIIEQMSSSAALYATSIRWDGSYHLDELKAKVESFTQTFPELKISQSMTARLALAIATAPGQKAPELSGLALDGRRLSLSNHQGKLVLIDFWASWCVPCHVENAHYRELRKSYPESEFQVFAINLDENASSWKTYSRRDQIDWPNISDGLGLKSPLAKAYGVSALPMSFLIDANGRIIAQGLRGEQLTQVLEKHLGKR